MTTWKAALISAALISVFAPLEAAGHDPQDTVLEQVGVDERAGQALPLDLVFLDAQGKRFELRQLFSGKPVLLTLNYYSCPTLCPQVLANLVRSLKKMEGLSAGRDFRVVTVSIDPAERQALAAEKAAATYSMYETMPAPYRNWPFLYGTAAAVEAITSATGVRSVRLADGEFAHPNVMVVVTPEGRISRYLYGIDPAPRDLKLALIEAAEGKIGTSPLINRALLYCFYYDPVGKKYVLIASRIMTAAMILVLLLTTALLSFLWRREPSGGGKGKRKAPPGN
ncbi:SCO family protein [Geomesophilobacter sediminis]|uniref:SCO family protein n=1 Tax=Geomesophilobacter sediminis TaxID=2798584 RepID=A0A8J7JBQ3_9BACT|nr:SCO family protein [Geomesophilobacter sediminis]MBJ6724028.1 SCO family protein [Geomesophilobacter sediminis]